MHRHVQLNLACRLGRHSTLNQAAKTLRCSRLRLLSIPGHAFLIRSIVPTSRLCRLTAVSQARRVRDNGLLKSKSNNVDILNLNHRSCVIVLYFLSIKLRIWNCPHCPARWRALHLMSKQLTHLQKSPKQRHPSNPTKANFARFMPRSLTMKQSPWVT